MMIAVTPRGFRDVLPQEARWREYITTQVQSVLSAWGYAPIETPTLEVLEVLEQGGAMSETPFRLFDSDGALLVLRPDVTLPIARMVASRLADRLSGTSEPLRFRYVQPVFREEESLRGQAREFTQIGVEYIGRSKAVSDAEVILLLVDALKACGLKDFTIAICTVSVLRELLADIVRRGDADAAWQEAVSEAFHDSNAVEVARLATAPGIDGRYGDLLKLLPDLRGGSDAVRRCKDLVAPLGLDSGLDQLEETYAIIEGAGAEAYVSVDFSVMSGFDYYTGLVFEAYAPKLGVSLGGGGRYDRMLEAYGSEAPAAGFAFSLERVMVALMEQGALPGNDILRPDFARVEVSANDPARAFVEAARLRAEGIKTVLSTNPSGAETR